MSSILTRIVETKANHIASLKARFGEALRPQVSTRSLYDALNQPEAGFILECKKASPSKGLIRDDFDVAHIATVYSRHASAVSVLTDETFFQGDMAYIPKVRALVEQPILCKDFFVSPYQIELAAHQGADAILLMLSVLSDEAYQALSLEASKYNLDILTEVSNQEELGRALHLNAKIIGINNRNLRDLSTDLTTTETLAPQIPAGTVIVSESGLYTHQDVRRLSPLVSGFLVGSSLMAEADLDLACRRLIYGENKVCGLTRVEDLLSAAQSGALYGGMIFAPSSKRKVDLETAKALVDANQTAPQSLRLVGVFVNQALEEIAEYATCLNLHAVQLHGQETEQDIQTLRTLLPTQVKIWKAVSVDAQSGAVAHVPQGVDRIIYDSKGHSGFGGSGELFDWQLPLADKATALLAGGLTPENATVASNAGFLGLDFNSGVESAPGVKDAQLISQAFQRLRPYSFTT